jgi:hypothetical protein
VNSGDVVYNSYYASNHICDDPNDGNVHSSRNNSYDGTRNNNASSGYSRDASNSDSNPNTRVSAK